MRLATSSTDPVVRRIPRGQSKLSLIIANIPRKKWEKFQASLSSLEKQMLLHKWDLWARTEQRPPDAFVRGDALTWVILGGRGMGKTRPGAEQVISWAKELGRDYGGGHMALIGKDPYDIRTVMIEGESGILKCSPPWFRPQWEPSKRELTWPNNVIAHTYSSETPDDLRGPQHHKGWGDEPGKWRHQEETWDMYSFGCRLGDHPQTVLTGTPRPTKTLMEILNDPDTVVTVGRTIDNEANLSKKFLDRIYRKYKGTRLGRQELNAELLTDTPGALWTLDMIDECRVVSAPPMKKIVIAIDPGVTDPKNDEEMESAETGIVAAGQGHDDHTYILHDLSGHYSAAGWGERAITHGQALSAEEIVGESNNGGDLVEFVVRTSAEKLGLPMPKYNKVWASRGKRTRAEPVSARYEQKRQHHVGTFAELEDQMTTWVPGLKSPDRMDAMVWATYALSFGELPEPPAGPPQIVRIAGF